jgi:hypothetical protein
MMSSSSAMSASNSKTSLGQINGDLIEAGPLARFFDVHLMSSAESVGVNRNEDRFQEPLFCRTFVEQIVAPSYKN